MSPSNCWQDRLLESLGRTSVVAFILVMNCVIATLAMSNIDNLFIKKYPNFDSLSVVKGNVVGEVYGGGRRRFFVMKLNTELGIKKIKMPRVDSLRKIPTGTPITIRLDERPSIFGHYTEVWSVESPYAILYSYKAKVGRWHDFRWFGYGLLAFDLILMVWLNIYFLRIYNKKRVTNNSSA